MCLACREMKPKTALSRIVMNTDGDISLDTTGKLPGRGAYVCNESGCIHKIKKSHGIERNFKRTTNVEIYDDIERRFAENE